MTPRANLTAPLSEIHQPSDRTSAYRWPRNGTPRARLWMAMRVLKRFDMVQLCMAADVTPDRAKDFLRNMVRTDYLRQQVGAHGVVNWIKGGQPWGPMPPRVEHLRIDGRSYLRVTDRNYAIVTDVLLRAHHQDRLSLPTMDGGVS